MFHTKRTYDTEDDFSIADDTESKTQIYAESKYLTQSAGVGLRFNTNRGSITATGYFQNGAYDVHTIRSKAS